MTSKKLLTLLLVLFSTSLFAEEPAITAKLYGFIRNDFYYNSRKNEESTDGTFNFFPKPLDVSAGIDKNAVPNAEMISVNTRLGLNISGADIFNAKSSAKIETDFAGSGSTYFLLRIRLAYFKLNWNKTELLIGQDWHPIFGSVIPSVMSLNNGAPFQPFNRSPQLRIKQDLSSTISLTGAAIYQMQFMSQGPLGASSTYLKNAIIPELYLGSECKTKHWTSGLGLEMKTIKPDVNQVTSFAATAYTQYSNSGLQLKAKTTYGENLSELNMLGGYGVSKYASDSTTVLSYTNLNTLSSWFNAVYGNKIQAGLLLGLAQNLGSSESLALRKGGKLTAYGCGFYDSSQQLLDRLYRISPSISYNLPNLRLGVEYDYTSALYGTIQNNGRVSNPNNVINHRVVATLSYIF